jgi:hypothetical protein
MTGRMKKKLMYFKPFPVCGNYGMEIRGIHGNFQNSGFHGYSIDRHGIWKNMTEKPCHTFSDSILRRAPGAPLPPIKLEKI